MLNRAAKAVARAMLTTGIETPLAAWLRSSRQRVADEVISRHRPQAAVLEPALAAGEPGAREALAKLAEGALAEMRAQVVDTARGTTRILASIDRRWGDCSAVEHMDDPSLDPHLRQRILDDLDAFNALCSYERFYELLRPLLHDGARLLDLAAGHGGFLLWVAQRARDEGLQLHLTASDLKREYLDLGAQKAARRNVDVNFVIQDALDLSNVAPAAFDVITTTQALHHFAPGQVAVMFETAARSARTAVVFIDGCRSVLAGCLPLLLALTRTASSGFAHDALISTRRFFVPEELGLLARIGPWGERVDARWTPPGHCVLTQRSR